MFETGGCRRATSARSKGFVKPWGTAFKILTFLQVAEASRPSNLASLHLVGSECLLQIFLPVKVRSAVPQLMDSNSIMLSPTNLKTCKRHTEETKAQSSIHDCTADQEMSCWAMPHGFSSYKPEQDLCASLWDVTQHRAYLPLWLKRVQLVQRHKCRHGQASEDT